MRNVAIGLACGATLALTEALSQASVKKYFLTSLSMDPASFDGLHFAGETIWETELTAPSADAATFNTAYQDACGHARQLRPRHRRSLRFGLRRRAGCPGRELRRPGP
ncbi:MAG TPA: hypothetical protein VIP09_05930 [Dehalococcoidia bacterium]